MKMVSLFDVDGTRTDPQEGITRAILDAQQQLGESVKTERAITYYCTKQRMFENEEGVAPMLHHTVAERSILMEKAYVSKI